MRKTFLVFSLASAAACSPGSSESESKRNLEEQADAVNDCCKIEGGEIGQEDVLVRLGTRYVLVHSWIPKTDSPGEYVGFSITTSSGTALDYVVKSGGERHPSSAGTWMHPNGPGGGSMSPGISHVDFCESCDDPDGCEDGGGTDGDCDNPDGCDGGDGGGTNDPGGDGGDGECDNPDGCDGGDGGGGDGGPILL